MSEPQYPRRREGDRRQVERRLVNDPTAYTVDRRTNDRRSGIDRRVIRNEDLAPKSTP